MFKKKINLAFKKSGLKKISGKASVATQGNVGNPVEGIRYGGIERLFSKN